MRLSRLRFLALVWSFALFAGAQASGQVYRDVSTGLTIVPPPGYSTHKLPADNDYRYRVNVLRADDTPETGCMVGFSPDEANPALTQAGVNLITRNRIFHARAREIFGRTFIVRSSRSVRYGAVAGFEVIGDFRKLPNLAASAIGQRASVVLLLTPKGLSSVICIDLPKRFERRRAEYQAVARGVRPPG